MKMKFTFLSLIAFLCFSSSYGQFNISAGATNYTQDFNALTSGTWTNNTTASGWYAKTDATASITSYGANTGTTTTAALYAFGVAGTNALTDRALGYAPSNGYTGAVGTGKGYIGWRLKNNTGSAIASITVTWTGEEWRKDNTVAQDLKLYYQTGTTVTNLTAGTWTTASSSFSSPVITAGAAALDGNAPANRTAGITATITVTIAAGDEIMLRWEDLNDTGNDHFLAIDDVTVNATLVNPVNGTIAAGEYGTHSDGANQQTNGSITYMNWDNTNLYVGVSNSTVGDGFVMYLDKDPQTLVNGGTNANGTNVGQNYDGTSFAELPYRADLVLYVKNSYREYRTANGSNAWSGATAAFGSYADNGSTIREFSIPWSAIGGRPAAFNFFTYVTTGGGSVSGQTPVENGSGAIGTSARYSRYYTVSATTAGSATLPFSRNSYVFTGTSDITSFGPITAYDFTMNTSGRYLSRTGSTAGNWVINGNLTVGNGTIYLGSGGGSYGTTSITGNINLLGGSFNMDQTNAAVSVTGNVSIASGATLALSGTSGGDITLAGNWSLTSGGTFTPNSRAVTFNGTTTQTITSTSGNIGFDYLIVNKATGNLQLNATDVTIGTTTGNVLQLLNVGQLDLNGRSLTLNNSGGSIYTNGTERKITSSAAAQVNINANKSVAFSNTATDEMVFDSNITVHVTNAAIDFGAVGKSYINGTLQLNANGGVTNAPIYGASSTLKYWYNGGSSVYGRYNEWNATGAGTIGTTKGYPNNVQISNTTILDLGANSGAGTARAMNGNLTVDDAAEFRMDGTSAMTQPLTINGNLILGQSGTAKLTLSNSVGGDIKLGGNINLNGTYNFTHNDRAIYFIKDGTQILTASSTPTFPKLIFAPLANTTTLQLASSLNVVMPSAVVIDFGSAANVLDIGSNTLTIGSGSVNNTVSGTSGTFKGTASSNLTLLGNSGSIGTLRFTGSQDLGTLTVNRQGGNTAFTLGSDLTINNSLVLTNGLVVLSNPSVLTMGPTATASGASSNSYVIADLGATSGTIRKNYTSTGSFTFPIGDRVGSDDGSQFTPATINFTSGTLSGYLTVGIFDLKHPNNDATTDYITRYWNVASSGTFTSPVYNFSGTYSGADVNGSEANSKPGRYDGTNWNDVSVTSIGGNVLSLTGLSTLSASNDFSAGSPIANAEINIKQGPTNYLHNSTYAFGNQGAGTSSSAITFTVQNLGAVNLLLNGIPLISKSGTNASDFSVDLTSTATSVSGFSSTTFTVTFSPTGYGAKTAAISIANNDATGGENPYVINLTGTGVTSANDFFQSAAGGGNWTNAAKWESSATGSAPWITATLAPGTSAAAIYIRNGNDININSNISADDITIESGTKLTVATGGTLTLNNGTAATDFAVNGTFVNSGGTLVQNAGSAMAFSATGIYNQTGNATTSLDIPIATWDVASNCNIKGVNNTNAFNGNASFGQTFGNFTWNNPDQGNFVNIANSAFRVNGILMVGGNVANLLSFSNTGTNSNTVNNIVVNGGTLNCAGNAGTSTLTVLGNITVSGGGEFNASYGGGTGNVNIAGNVNVNNNGYFVGSLGTGIGNVNVAGDVNVATNGELYVAFDTGAGNMTAANVNVNGGNLYVAYDSGNASLITTQNINVDAGIFSCSYYTGTATVTAGANLEISGSAYVVLIDDPSSPSTTINVTNNLIITGNGDALLSLEDYNSTGVATVNVGGNFNCDATGLSVDFGSNAVAGNAINITGNFDKSGTGTFFTFSTSAATGFAFGAGVHTFKYAGADSQWTPYVVKSGAKVQLLSGLNLDISSTIANPPSTFTIEAGGTLDFQTYAIKAGNSSFPRFITVSGATLLSANTNGLGGVSAVGSLQNFGSIGSTSAAGRAVFPAGVNYTFNGTTILPFPVPTSTAGTNNFGIPAVITVNGNVTSNMITNLSVSTSMSISNGGTFKLATTNNNSLNLNNAALTIALGGTFDNGGTNQVLNGGGSSTIQVGGTFITRDPDGFVGTGAAVPGLTPTLSSGGTVEYAGADQAVQGTIPGSQKYQNITFSGTGTKTLNTTNAVVGTITVNDVVFNADNHTFGSSTSGITMTGNAVYKLNGSSLKKPESGGTYVLGPNTTFEFTGTSATEIRVASPTITYSNILVSGTSLTNDASSTGIKFRAGGTFTVNNGATFKLKNTAGFTGSTTTAIDTSTNGGPTISLATGSKIEYIATVPDIQTITPFASYSDVGVSGTGTKVLGSTTEVLVGRNLSVTAGTLQIDSDRLLTVTDAITTVDNAINVKNNGSLVQINDASVDSGKIIATRTSRAMAENDYIYWGSPVQGDVTSQIPAVFDVSYSWVLNGAEDGYWDYLSATTPGMGFISRIGSAATTNFDFNGVPNNGIINVAADSFDNGVTVAASGNTILLANPYPCALDAKKFIDENSGSLEGTLYFWTSTTPITNNVYTSNDYASWNFSGGTTTGGSALTPTGKIGTGQGFFANLKSDSGIVFKNLMRVHDVATDNSQFFRNSNSGPATAYNRIWLNITNPDNAFRQALVGYVTDATNSFDSKFDGYNFTDNVINISSLLNNKAMVIQGRALPFDVNDHVPLSVKIPTAGSNTIAIDHMDGLFALDQNIYLQDNLLNVIHDLKAASYTFDSEAGTFNDRFVLRYTNGTLDVGEIDYANGIIIAKDKNQLKIKSQTEAIDKIVAFDLLGRKVFEKYQINNNTFFASDIVLNQQTLIVKVTLANGILVTKKVVF